MKEYPISKIETIRQQGRNGKTKGGALVLFWAASALEINVRAREVWAHISADYEDQEIWLAVEVNGYQTQRFIVPKEENWICLARNLNPQRENFISIIKDTQPMPGDKKHILKLDALGLDDAGVFCPLPERKCRIEFVGDSLTSGEGLAGRFDEMDWIAQWFCASRTFAVQTAKLMNGDWACISQSGWGMCWGWDGAVDSRITAHYEGVCDLLDGPEQKSAGSLDAWDFCRADDKKSGSDFVIINLGTNDEMGFQYHKDRDAIINEVKRFLNEVRSHNPGAKIIWCWGILKLQLVPELIQEGISEYKKENGDNAVYTLELEDMTEIEKCDEDRGSREHPGLLAHKKAAEKIVEFISKI